MANANNENFPIYCNTPLYTHAQHGHQSMEKYTDKHVGYLYGTSSA